MFNMSHQAALTARTHPNYHTTARTQATPVSRLTAGLDSSLRELDFSDALTDWFGAVSPTRREPSPRLAGLDLDRALAFAG
jgi:hypothetical protein